MKKLHILMIIVAAILLFLVVGMFFWSYILEPFGLTPRLWLRTSFYFLSGLFAVALEIIFLIICVFRFKHKSSKKTVSLIITLVFLPIGFVIGASSVLGYMLDSSSEWVVEDAGHKYVYEHTPLDIGSGPYVDLQYGYVNWFVRGEKVLNPKVFN